MNIFDIISAALGLTVVVLAGRRSKYNFWVGYAYNIFLFMLFWKQRLFAAMILQPVAFAINIFGHWRWTHPRAEERSGEDGLLKVSALGLRQVALLLAAVTVFGALWGYVLKTWTSDPLPWLDSYVLMITFLAQYLSAQKKWECWIVWIVVNVCNMTLYLKSGLVFMPMVSALYLINGVWSLYSWKKSYENER